MYLSEPLGIGEAEQTLSVRTSGPDDAVESVPADPGFAPLDSVSWVVGVR
jgi:hypothetical protein